MRALRAGLLALALLGLGAVPARAADPPALDVPAAQRALESAQVFSAPGAVATFDRAQVRLSPTTKVLLAPPEPLTQDRSASYDAVYKPLADWSRERDVDLILVTGVSVQIVGQGTVTQSDLGEVRETLAYRDVTEPLRFAARRIVDRTYEDDVEPFDDSVAASPDLVEQVVTGLRGTPRWAAPGVQSDLDTSVRRWPDVPVRVAVLPVLTRGTPYPDLLTPLARAFPGELVVVVRGSWIEAVAPDQAVVDSARNYTLGAARNLLYERAVTPRQEVGFFLDRLVLLRSGEPFGRAQVDGLSVGELWDRYAAPVALVLVIGLAGSSLLWFGVPHRRPVATVAEDYRRERAEVFARLSRVSEQVVGSRRGSPAAARAGERHQAAVDLLEQADATNDTAVLSVAADAVSAAEDALRSEAR